MRPTNRFIPQNGRKDTPQTNETQQIKHSIDLTWDFLQQPEQSILLEAWIQYSDAYPSRVDTT